MQNQYTIPKQLQFQDDLSLETVMPLLNPIYPQEYFEKSKRFNRMLQNKQYTIQANELAQYLITYLQSNYNCWLMKKMCLKAGVLTPQIQLAYSKKILLGKVKNFQIWEYRRFLTDITKDYPPQYQLVQQALAIQYKNYHAWSYRLWLARLAKNWQQQIQKVDKHIKKDQCNNSAWTYKFFLVNQFAKQSNKEMKKKLFNGQILGAIERLQKNPKNEAVWNYLRGFFPAIKLKEFPQNNPAPLSYEEYPQIQSLCKKIINENQNDKSVQALITNVFVYSQNEQTKQYAIENCQILTIRQPQKIFYWRWVQSQL